MSFLCQLLGSSHYPKIITERLTITSRTSPCTTTTQPQYSLALTYVRSTSGGKSLLARGKVRTSKEYTAFFDEAGVLDQDTFEQWLGGVVESAMEGKVE
jgi:signal peptidase complex subunit 2